MNDKCVAAVALSPQAPANELKHDVYVDISPLVCADDFCPTVHDGYLMYRDKQHLSVPYVIHLTDALHRDLARVAPDLFRSASK